ncbi:hypothetical protein TNCT_392881, partial [Trichonephila clavata]
RRGDMTSIDQGSWSDRTDATTPSVTGLGACESRHASPSAMSSSSKIRCVPEAIKARNVYAAGPGTDTGKTDDPDLQNFHLQLGSQVRL